MCKNAYTRYLQTRTGASVESVRRLREIDFTKLGTHPIFKSHCMPLEADKQTILGAMKQYRPKGVSSEKPHLTMYSSLRGSNHLNLHFQTVFELGGHVVSPMYQAMKAKRDFHETNIVKHKQKVEERLKNTDEGRSESSQGLTSSTQDDIDDTFSTVINPAKRRIYDAEVLRAKKMRKKNKVDEKHYIPYSAPDKYSEEG